MSAVRVSTRRRRVDTGALDSVPGVTVSIHVGAWPGNAVRLTSDLRRLSMLLADEGITWSAPSRDTAVPPVRSAVRGFPASWIQDLKRIVALVETGAPVTPADCRGVHERGQALVREEAAMLSSHLICHSSAEGYFVPVDLSSPVFLPEGSGVAGGGVVGSSQGLMRELRRCADDLGITLDDDGTLGDAEAARVAALPDEHPFAVECVAWLALHEASRTSMATGHAVVLA